MWVDRDSNPEGNATKDGKNAQFVDPVSATTVTDSDARQRIVTASVAERGSVPAAREHWQAALRSALRARATELAATAPGGTDTITRALVIALEAAKAASAWAEVAELTRALDGHRRGRETVVDLAARRRRGRGT